MIGVTTQNLPSFSFFLSHQKIFQREVFLKAIKNVLFKELSYSLIIFFIVCNVGRGRMAATLKDSFPPMCRDTLILH